MSNTIQYKIYVSGNAPREFPTETFYGLLYYGDNDHNVIEVPQLYPFCGEWGEPLSTHILLNKNEFPLPQVLEMVWLSIAEAQFYSIETELPKLHLEKMWQKSKNGNSIYDHIVVGMAPKGYVALWVWGLYKSDVIGWYKAESTVVPMELFLPNHPELEIEEYCEKYIESLDSTIGARLLEVSFTAIMQQFTYRYLLQFEKWNDSAEEWTQFKEDEKQIPEFEYIEESLYDGTHDKLHDDGLLKYHKAGKPKRLAIKWHFKKSEYTTYFWFEDERICSIFERFYGAHPDTNTDFIIRIDAEKKKYELALFRQGLKEPQIIPEDAYQLLVFKNKFEDYRSDNYNQDRGAWIW